MYDEHDDDEEREVELSAYSVVVSGPFGMVVWNVCSELYDMMPRADRNSLLDMTGEREIKPFLEKTVRGILRQGGCTQNFNSLCAEPSSGDDDRKLTCCYGTIRWAISKGVLEALPDDTQATRLLEVGDQIMQAFFHRKIYHPLAEYSVRKMQS